MQVDSNEATYITYRNSELSVERGARASKRSFRTMQARSLISCACVYKLRACVNFDQFKYDNTEYR